MPHTHPDNAPWYRQKVFWILMAGPIIVVFAALATWRIASQNADDLVSDDYYKDGKHINLYIERDAEAAKLNVEAQVFFNSEGTAAKVFVGGKFQHGEALKLLLLHPAKKAFDQTLPLQASSAPRSGDKSEYTVNMQPLPRAVHWYVRLENEKGTWRVENKWLPSQGASVTLKPKAVLNENAASAP